ncbi:MAG: hypothetical protein AAFY02_05465 [Pseudomonadota bacterium]
MEADIDPQHLLLAGWSAEELYWEELSAAALALPPREAIQYWEEAARIAPEAFTPEDARHATTWANLALVSDLEGRPEAAADLLDQAVAQWQAAETWVAGLRAERRARSSLFHHRLQQKHSGGYDHWRQARYRDLYQRGAEALAARRQGTYRPDDPSATWVVACPPGLEDARRLIAAVMLIAPNAA